jgi:hypothetical protein
MGGNRDLPDRKQKGPTLGIRRGIPVALIIIFSSALLFQLFLFSYAVNIIWRNYTAGVISLLTESLNRSANDVFRLEGKEGTRMTGKCSIREIPSHYRKTKKASSWFPSVVLLLPGASTRLNSIFRGLERSTG